MSETGDGLKFSETAGVQKVSAEQLAKEKAVTSPSPSPGPGPKPNPSPEPKPNPSPEPKPGK